MFIAISILFGIYFMVRLFSYASKPDYVVNWDNMPKIEGGIKLSHTVKPDNPLSEEEWYQHIFQSRNKIK